METHCQIPPGALTVEETAVLTVSSQEVCGELPHLCPSDRSEQADMFKQQIPLYYIQDECHNWYAVCTSNTSSLCQLMEQQEAC